MREQRQSPVKADTHFLWKYDVEILPEQISVFTHEQHIWLPSAARTESGLQLSLSYSCLHAHTHWGREKERIALSIWAWMHFAQLLCSSFALIHIFSLTNTQRDGSRNMTCPSQLEGLSDQEYEDAVSLKGIVNGKIIIHSVIFIYLCFLKE